MELKDVEALYDELMNLIIRFADSGVIHSDFNEFNIMITDEEKAIIIDFPQMVSTAHPNAEMFFSRDVNCIRNFFKKRFGFESELYPKFTDIERSDALDAEVLCSGFTKQMAKDINLALGIDTDEEDENEEEKDSDNATDHNNHDEYPQEKYLNTPADYKTEDSKNSDQSILQSDQNETSIDMIFNKIKLSEGSFVPKDGLTGSSDEGSVDYSDIIESRSVRSSATTIHPEEIKNRLRKQLISKEKRNQKKKCVAKGEASAVTRVRRENNDNIKQSKGLWGWE